MILEPSHTTFSVSCCSQGNTSVLQRKPLPAAALGGFWGCSHGPSVGFLCSSAHICRPHTGSKRSCVALLCRMPCSCYLFKAATAACAVFILIDRIRSLMHYTKAFMQLCATCMSQLCLAGDSSSVSSVWRTAFANLWRHPHPVFHGWKRGHSNKCFKGSRENARKKRDSRRKNRQGSLSWVVCGERRVESIFTEANVLLRLLTSKVWFSLPLIVPARNHKLLAVGFLSIQNPFVWVVLVLKACSLAY